jgi:hypothetical protein
MPNLSDYNPAVKYGANLDVNLDLADIRDANDNELLELDTVASAMNFVSIRNSVTGADPGLTAAGDDTNVDLELAGKGTGIVVLGSSTRGTIVSGSVTINAQRGVVITTALAVASTSIANFDLINNRIQSDSVVLYTLDQWTGSAGRPYLGEGTVVVGRTTFAIGNAPVVNAGSAQLNGTAAVRFVVL